MKALRKNAASTIISVAPRVALVTQHRHTHSLKLKFDYIYYVCESKHSFVGPCFSVLTAARKRNNTTYKEELDER